MVGQARVVHLGHLRVVLQEVHHLQRVLHVALHAQRERLQPLNEQEGVERRQARALVPHERRAKLDDVGQIPHRVGENHAMVGGVGLRQAGEFAAGRPVELSTVHNHTAHGCAVSANELRRRVDYDIRAVLNGPQKVGCGKGVIHDEGNAVPVRHRRDSLQIDHIRVGVAQRLGVEQFRVGLDSRIEVSGVGRVNECRDDALLRQCVGKKVIGPAVEICGGDDVVSSDGNVLHGVGDGRRAGGSRQCRSAALQRCDALFKNVVGGVHQTGVDVAGNGETKASRRRRGVLEHIGGGGIDGHGPCVGGRVRALLPHVELQCLKFILFLAHCDHILSFCRSVFCSGSPFNTVLPASTELVSHTLPPMMQRSPMTVSPPNIVAPEYITTSLPMSG